MEATPDGADDGEGDAEGATFAVDMGLPEQKTARPCLKSMIPLKLAMRDSMKGKEIASGLNQVGYIIRI